MIYGVKLHFDGINEFYCILNYIRTNVSRTGAISINNPTTGEQNFKVCPAGPSRCWKAPTYFVAPTRQPRDRSYVD